MAEQKPPAETFGSRAEQRMYGVIDDDGNLLIGQRGDGSPIWNSPEDPLPLKRVAHFTEDGARRKAWELAGLDYGPTGISELHHAPAAGVTGPAGQTFPAKATDEGGNDRANQQEQ